MKVTDIMTRKVLSVDSASDGYEAAKLMFGDRGGCVLVENNDTVIGIITCRDFIEGILEWRTAPSEMRVRQMMSSPVHMIDSEATVEKAAALMSSKRIRRLPVLKDEKIIGMVLAGDLAKLVVAENSEEVTKKGRVSEHLDITLPISLIPSETQNVEMESAQ